MWVKYFIPEDGDDQNHPNIYQIPNTVPSSSSSSSSGITLNQIKETFPLPGYYQFRYLKNISPSLQVWFDVSDGNAILPVGDGIFLKVTRISSGRNNIQENGHNSRARTNPPAKVLESKPSVPTKVSPIRVPAPEVTQLKSKQPSTSEKLLQFDAMDDYESTTPTAKTSSTTASKVVVGHEDLLGMDSSVPLSTNQSTSKNNSNIDLFGLDTLQPIQPTITPTSSTMPTRNSFTGTVPLSASSPYGAMNSSGLGAGRGTIDPFSNLDNSGKSVGGGGYDRRGSTGQQQPPSQPPKGTTPPQRRLY